MIVNHASNVIGTVQPVGEIGARCRERGITMLIDASQTAGKVPVDLESMNLDVVAFTGHKSLFGPTGIGGLCVRDGVQIRHTRAGGTGVRLETVLYGHLAKGVVMSSNPVIPSFNPNDLLQIVLNAPESSIFALIHQPAMKVYIGYTSCLLDRLIAFKHDSLDPLNPISSSVLQESTLRILETYDNLDIPSFKKELYLKTKASEYVHQYRLQGYDFYNSRNIIIWKKKLIPELSGNKVRHVVFLVNAVGKKYRIKAFANRDHALEYLDTKLPSEMILDMQEDVA